MPILKHNQGYYPVDWAEITQLIKESNHWTCQECGLQCRRPGEEYDTQRRTLTIAHWDSMYDTPWVLLVPLCPKCHLRHDAPHRPAARQRNLRLRLRQAGQMELRLEGRAA